METRETNYRSLIAYFEAHTYDPVGLAMPRYAAVAQEFFDDNRVGAKIALCETEQQAFSFLGESVLDGYGADGVYDLDTSAKIYVAVEIPVVTRATDQDQGFNPLADGPGPGLQPAR